MKSFWKKKYVPLWKSMLIRLPVMLLLLALSRSLLYFFNVSSFPDVTFGQFFKYFFVGLRFDLYTLAVFNIPLILLYGLPFKFKYNRVYEGITDGIFIFCNTLAVSLNLADVIYFRYISKRMTFELFNFASMKDDNQAGVMLHIISDFWFIALIIAVFLFVIIMVNRKTKVAKPKFSTIKPAVWYTSQTAGLVLMSGLVILAMRGGFQHKPMNLSTAALYAPCEEVPLVLNTPFSICNSMFSKTVDRVEYVDDETIDSLYSPLNHNMEANRFIKEPAENYNVVILIMESFGQEMISFYNQERTKTITPFLDSLFSQSLTFNGIANGRRSVEALPSIFLGIPSLMPKDFFSSPYVTNQFEGIGHVLKRHGYNTAFFHGGNNGTMRFDVSANASGFDGYFGRDEYDNEDDYDGTWGIFDGPFLQFVSKELDAMPKPFASAIFTLSSHHPYSLPKDYNLPDPSITSICERTVRYSDDAFRDFFHSMSQYDWYDSTIFILVADHVNPEHLYDNYHNGYGQFLIPIAFYCPSMIEPQRTDEIAQQADIAVSTISALGITDTVFSFGRNLFDSLTEPSAVSCLNTVFQYIDGKHILQSDGQDIKAVYDIQNDRLLHHNLYTGNDTAWSQLDRDLKLRLQQYNNRMIDNRLKVAVGN